MTYTILGPRVLLKVKKFNEKEFAEKRKYIEGSSIIQAPDVENFQEELDREIGTQTIGIIEQVGPTVNTTYEGFSGLQVGQKVHFQRYGAQRINVKENSDFERWIINGKDILCIEKD